MTSRPNPFSTPADSAAAASANTPPAITIPTRQQTDLSDVSGVLTSSSPVFSRSHPFLRKFQSQATPLSTAGASSFSTSAGSNNGSNSNNNDNSGNGSKRVDDAIAAVAANAVNSKSPTIAAAKATDALLNKRLSHLNLNKKGDDDIFTSQAFDHAAHGPGCGCSGGDYSDSDDDMRVEPSQFPPISDEARLFSETLLGQNKEWARKTEQDRPGFFAKLEKQQKPQVLWIGCSDSRVPANQIVNLDPGEIFVHRNIANVVTHTDMNLLSVLEYAVDVLKVRHIIICGHYGCGGVAASLTQKQFGIIDNWLRNIKDLYTIHRKKFDTLPQGGKEQQDLLTELNVIQSALNVSHTSIIQKAWSRGEKLSVHGWCYRLSDGVIRNLGLCIEGPGNVEEVYHVMDEVKSSH
ncbi:hypothetical protein BGZ75_008420 [Mortierella antarctica]|nr:hypothetical protein BGZ67_003144 [Mortierella alpina]KAF9980447.1 hypothetical protein BGZ75_008420 [Mortierella antarctica]